MKRLPEIVKETLRCPQCGNVYDNYRDFFDCWTSHLKPRRREGGVAPMDHNEAVNYYRHNPNAIEKGLRILAKEVSVFHGRIDLIGVDGHNNLVIIDVTLGHDWKRKVEQLKRYKKNLEWIARNIFGLPKLRSIRLLVVKPNDYVKDVTPRSYVKSSKTLTETTRASHQS